MQGMLKAAISWKVLNIWAVRIGDQHKEALNQTKEDQLFWNDAGNHVIAAVGNHFVSAVRLGEIMHGWASVRNGP